jgi:hypothetical protein
VLLVENISTKEKKKKKKTKIEFFFVKRAFRNSFGAFNCPKLSIKLWRLKAFGFRSCKA